MAAAAANRGVIGILKRKIPSVAHARLFSRMRPHPLFWLPGDDHISVWPPEGFRPTPHPFIWPTEYRPPGPPGPVFGPFPRGPPPDIGIFGGFGDIETLGPLSRNFYYIYQKAKEAIAEYNAIKPKHEQLYFSDALKATTQLISGCDIYHVVFKATKGSPPHESETYEAIGFEPHAHKIPPLKLVLLRKSNDLPISLNDFVGEICERPSPSSDPMITNAAHLVLDDVSKKTGHRQQFKQVIRATTQVIKAASEMIRAYRIIRLRLEGEEYHGTVNVFDAIVLVLEHDAQKMEFLYLWISGVYYSWHDFK